MPIESQEIPQSSIPNEEPTTSEQEPPDPVFAVVRKIQEINAKKLFLPEQLVSNTLSELNSNFPNAAGVTELYFEIIAPGNSRHVPTPVQEELREFLYKHAVLKISHKEERVQIALEDQPIVELDDDESKIFEIIMSSPEGEPVLVSHLTEMLQPESRSMHERLGALELKLRTISIKFFREERDRFLSINLAHHPSKHKIDIQTPSVILTSRFKMVKDI